MTTFNQKITTQKCINLADEIADNTLIYPIVYEAFAQIPRELFIPIGMKKFAYTLDALPMSSNQWISSPLTVAKMTQALNIEGVDSVLEIGCGSGYQAAILSKIVRRVFTVERIEGLLKEAKQRFSKLNISNIHTRFDDGQKGWRSYAPYERILLSASIEKIPQNLFLQLKNGGILVAPMVKGNKQIITRFTKNGDDISEEMIDECIFVPILDGTQR